MDENSEHIPPETLLTSYQVGELLQVNPSSVNKWVKDGRLPAFRTPGGHRRIRAADLVSFLNAHCMPIPRPLADAGKRRLLIVDDDNTQLSIWQRQLKPFNEHVEVALVNNGIDALVQVGSFNPHAVLLDVIMDDLDGIEVCKRLKSNPETDAIRVIVASNLMDDTMTKAALGAGACKALSKPVELEALLSELGLSAAVALVGVA